MAIYRYVRTSFWQDDFVLELTPEEKYFYIYLMTNFKTTQCGIFKLAKKIVEAEIGYSRETIEKLLKRFIDYGKIAYCEETKELMILNWMKYNFSSSKNTIACINKELKEIEHKEFINILYKICVDRDYPVEEIFKGIEVDTDCDGENIKKETECDEEDIYVNIEDEAKCNGENVCKDIEVNTSNVYEDIENDIDYDLENTFEVDEDEKIISPYEGAYKGLGEKETKKEKEIKKSSSKKEKAANRSKGTNKEKGIRRILLKFNKNIHQATKRDKEKIRFWSSSLEEGVIIAAISEAVKYNARHIGYIETVIKSWKEQGIATMEKLNKSKEKPNRCNNRCNTSAYVYVD